MHYKIIVPAICLLSLFTQQIQAETYQQSPWTIHETAGLPSWLQLSVQHRTRYETFDNSVKKNGHGGDQLLSFRTQVFAEASYQQFKIGAEFIDSRTEMEDSGTALNNAMINETALLQAYLAWQTHDFLHSGLGAEIKFGRQTMDVGSRRLVARNRFRNTLNNFNGVNMILHSGKNWQWRNFIVLPVSRLPNDQASLRQGVIEFDEENFNTVFAGSFFAINQLWLNSHAELYFYQLSEDDNNNRNLSTPGLRWYRQPDANHFNFELEAAIQTGTSHASNAATDTKALDHFAYFGHAAIGYTFSLPWSPRLLLQYDYASGDSDPNDGRNGRFETLYGARRFEFGPTGIWGAFARANISTPGIRLQFKPQPNITAFIAHRGYWLAEKRDTWVGGNLRDVSGQASDYLGQQIEARIRWKIIPKMITLETGWAHLFKGDFIKNAPSAPADKNDSDYFYAQTSFAF